jgi:alkylhydroperoxidase/carboxymuconolactone decarboxylase family protein YurZ
MDKFDEGCRNLGVAEYARLSEAFESELIRGADNLLRADLMVAQISAATGTWNWPRLETLADQAPQAGLAMRSVCEVCLQTTLYVGTAAMEPALAAIGKVLASRGLCIEPNSDAPVGDVAKAAHDMRRKLHAERHDAGYADPNDMFTAPLYETVAHNGYGLIWNRPGLSLRQRLICAVAGNMAAGTPNVLGKFMHSSLAHGINSVELREILIQTTPYVGTPLVLGALIMLREVVKDHDEQKKK